MNAGGSGEVFFTSNDYSTFNNYGCINTTCSVDIDTFLLNAQAFLYSQNAEMFAQEIQEYTSSNHM